MSKRYPDIHAEYLPSADIVAECSEVAIEAADSEKKGPRKFDVLAYTGGALSVKGYDLPVVVDLKGMTRTKSLVANLDHKGEQRVGHVDKVDNNHQQLRLSGSASAATPFRQEVIASADDGFGWQASIEAAPLKMVKVPEGKTVEVNGQSFDGPIYVARKSRLKGFAFVSHGADDNTTVSIAASKADSTKEKSMEPKLKEWIEAMGFDVEALSEQQIEGLKVQHAATVKASAAPAKEIVAQDDGFDADDIKAAAADHLANLEAIFAEHEDEVKKDAFATIRAEASKESKALKVQALKERWTTEKYESRLIKAAANVELKLVRAERPQGPAIHSGNKLAGLKNDVIEAALCQTLGVPDYEKGYKAETLEAAHSAFRGRMGIQQLLIMAASANGCDVRPGERLHNGNLRSVMQNAFAPIEASFSTISLSGILGNVANKEILAGYMEEDQAWREISVIKSVSDFKATTSYRMLDNMAYEELGAGGEIKGGKLSEESYTRQAKTYAKMFGITRTDIINDDLGAFDDLRNRLGRGAAQRFNDVFWAKFLYDHATFYTTARTNYITGATTNLATDGVGLALGVKAFRQMTSPSADGSKRIGGRPEILLVPPELENAAEVLHKNSNLGAVAGSSANIYAGKYKPVVSAWLSDSNFTGYSTTAWYLLRSPSVMASMVVSFLNGMQAPTVESADADFNVLGVQFRGYHDFGCDQAEYLAGVKSKGAA